MLRHLHLHMVKHFEQSLVYVVTVSICLSN